MKNTLAALALSTLLIGPALAGDGNDQGQNNNDQGRTRAAPGPIAGAGVPALIIAGGAYWLIKRRRRRSESSDGSTS
jgi:hypothetical protein